MAMDESNSALDLNINDSDRLSLTGFVAFFLVT